MELIKLHATKRTTKGKGAARKMRSKKNIPAVIYGPKIDPMMLCLETSEFDKIIRDRGTSGLFLNVKIQGEEEVKSKVVMLKDLQMDTYGIEYLHADFHQIDMDTLVTVAVPIVPVGISKGVKESGGMLQIIRRELEVVCKPADTPESIEIDVADLDIGDAVHVEEIDLGEAVEIPHEVNFTVITIVAPDAGEEEELAEDELLEEEMAETEEVSAEEPSE
ncbi:MAG TPA: 50S ribosomal protein L25 [Desulfotignum sp.]|nr:50S ribosomal protein L25 [Desulfotignum sp.]